jgi:hypothetical protein
VAWFVAKTLNRKYNASVWIRKLFKRLENQLHSTELVWQIKTTLMISEKGKSGTKEEKQSDFGLTADERAKEGSRYG